jgi:hypothetical protein
MSVCLEHTALLSDHATLGRSGAFQDSHIEAHEVVC